ETRIRAVGTQFDVYRKPTGTVVTVVEGRVSVKEAADTRSEQLLDPVLLSTGEQLTVSLTAPAALTPKPANLKAATAWTQRRLIFSGAPLAEVASEFNRYNERRLIIDTSGLDNFRINGIFSSADPAALLGFLREQPGVAVVETDREIRISKK